MATLFVDKVDPQSGTSLEIGSSGDTITIPSGATIANSGTATGFGGDNTPAFMVSLYNSGSNVSVAHGGANVKVNFDNEIVDTDNAFASGKFTVPSGEAGKYLISYRILLDNTTNSNINYALASIYKNGSQFTYDIHNAKNHPQRTIPIGRNLIMDLAVSDYLEIYINASFASGTGQLVVDQIGTYNHFSGFKLIGV